MRNAFEFFYFYPLFLLLIPLGVALLSHYFSQRDVKAWLTPSLIPFSKFSFFLLRGVPLLILILTLVALMGPRGNPHYSKSEIETREKLRLKADFKGTIAVVIDTSASMSVSDSPTKESRLKLAKELADEVLAASPTSYKALYALGSTLVKRVPRTMDTVFTRLLIKQMELDEGGAGTDFLQAFEKLGDEVSRMADPVAVLLLSDGEDPQLLDENEESRVKRYQEIQKKFEEKSGRKVPIFAVAFGSAEGGVVPGVLYKGKPVISKRNEALLKSLSKGNLWIFESENKGELTQKIIQSLSTETKEASVGFAYPQDSLIWSRYFQIPLFLALLGLVFYLAYPRSSIRKGGMMGLILMQLAAFDTSEWTQGATIYNQALSSTEKGDPEEAYQELTNLKLDEKSSPYVFEKINELKALMAIHAEEKENEPLRKLLEQVALYSLIKAENARCEFEKVKGYDNCSPSYFIEEFKKGVKLELIEPKKELSLASFGLEWIDRIKLILENEAYYSAFLPLVNEKLPMDYKEALTKFSQKDFKRSLQLFEEVSQREIQKVKEMSSEEFLKDLLSQDKITIYDLQLRPELVNEEVLVKFKQGEFFWGRLLLMERLGDLENEKESKATPQEVIQSVVKRQNEALILTRYSEFLKDYKGLERVQGKVMNALEPFLKVSQSYRKSQFLEKGCETVPWEALIPLYEKGKGEAMLASKQLDNDAGLVYQKLALNHFKEMLKLFESSKSMSETSKAKESLSETVRQFQDFELMDRASKGVEVTPLKVERPW